MKVTVETNTNFADRPENYAVVVDGVTVALYNNEGSLIVFDPETPHDYNEGESGGVVFTAHVGNFVKVRRNHTGT